MTTESAADYLAGRGLKETSPDALNRSLRRVLDAMEPMVYEEPSSGLTAAEQAVLEEGGLRLKRSSGRDLVAETAVKFAAIVERSLTAEAVSAALEMTSSRVRQLIATGELYSFRLDGKRLVPDFQIRDGQLFPNISDVNRVLPKTLHPVGVYNWFHLPNADLFVDEDMEELRSPLEWLAEGRDPAKVVTLAERL
jgi:hypothetical protein